MDHLNQKYLLLFQLDAEKLLSRLLERREEYLEIFALRRTRDHFEKIFFTRYYQTIFSELAHLSDLVIKKIDHFYHLVDDLHWYMYSTQNMPGAVGEELDRYLARLTKSFDELNDQIKLELGIEDVPEIPIVPIDSDSEEVDEDQFKEVFQEDEQEIDMDTEIDEEI